MIRREGFTVWLTGLPCSGKTTLAERLAETLRAGGLPVEVLDGDAIRRHLSHELGYSREDRDANVRRIGFVAGLLSRHGVCAVVAAVSPYRQVRDELRAAIGRFVEVHVDCPVSECERRDVKGMYARARRGELVRFTGIDDPYEPPTEADVMVQTDRETPEESTAKILAALRERRYVP